MQGRHINGPMQDYGRKDNGRSESAAGGVASEWEEAGN